MNKQSRTANSLRNVILGLGSQILILLSTFISRTVFIAILGAEYLGVNGLYNSIILVLSLAELGVANVMIFSLYKPVAKNDEVTISALLKFYRGLYIKISFAILIIGLGIVPFLNLIINSELFLYRELVIYYLLFLLNSVVSYLFAYKIALINADQKNYIITSVKTLTFLIRDIAQIIILITIKSYYIFLILLVISTILNNIILSKIADKHYPFINKFKFVTNDKNEEISKLKIEIKEKIKSTFLYKIGVVIMNNTDNILISIIVGTIFVGYYSNYGLIISAITTFITIFIQAIYSSIGNLNASSNTLNSYHFFNVLVLFFHWLSAFISACFLLVFNDFITIWIGNEYLLGFTIVFAITFNFYIQNIINPVWIYRETMGLFNEIKYLMLYASLINLLLSVFLGMRWGIEGIIISTALARIFTTVWYEPKLLYKVKFNKPITNYWKMQSKHILTSVLAVGIVLLITKDLPISLGFILLKIILCFFVVSSMFLVMNLRNKELKELNGYVKQFIRR
ncbi:polysaccharide biosynthesis C-terminal domain-containing protein [Bacillus sp. MCCB 382]|uniref:lipopolysaccharide biosynthesis protein n=1 Tax=Bacillus sp. MCCB 382 TaxID=2860197 RepID=UPI001C57E481|nr:polysaccharide biosynthesis C-terminal domain-containing protein [Bacillus sp. MCCB 382]